jgi:hypothetical protein
MVDFLLENFAHAPWRLQPATAKTKQRRRRKG